jgi:predicted thioesterase
MIKQFCEYAGSNKQCIYCRHNIVNVNQTITIDRFIKKWTGRKNKFLYHAMAKDLKQILEQHLQEFIKRNNEWDEKNFIEEN